ncbi:hypothetical protein Bca52824_080277 [Brassica carinata]|uniref:Uncharacterized protein n=1 Tax=Brassica carinata TaxID=52824 RepID=A0A8X7TQT3_BRACI|nr:hypothetical protein Bca52824_080277 [Brassica carinata]
MAFLVGGAICLVNSVSERDLSLLTSYAGGIPSRRLLRGTMVKQPRKFEAITGGSPADVSEKSTKPYHLEEGEVVTRFPWVNLRKDHYRNLEASDTRALKHHSRWAGFLAYFAYQFRGYRLSPDQFRLDYTHSFRISPNPGTKSVKEHSTKRPAFANPEAVFVEAVLQFRPKPSGRGHACLVSQIVVPILSRISDEAGLRVLRQRLAKIRAKDARAS